MTNDKLEGRDLPVELREAANLLDGTGDFDLRDACREAADEIERLRAERDEAGRLRDHWLSECHRIFKAGQEAAYKLEPLTKRSDTLAEALRRIANLTPNAANARTAGDLYLTVRAIADSAIACAALNPEKQG